MAKRDRRRSEAAQERRIKKGETKRREREIDSIRKELTIKVELGAETVFSNHVRDAGVAASSGSSAAGDGRDEPQVGRGDEFAKREKSPSPDYNDGAVVSGDGSEHDAQ